jgi:hypothetical protein
MPRGRSKNNSAGAAQDSAAKLGFEAKLWRAADALRNNQQYGCGRIQARRARSDFPQIHFRRIRGEAARSCRRKICRKSSLMAEFNLTQEEANILIAMEKHRVNEDHGDFPMRGQSLTLPLQSADKRAIPARSEPRSDRSPQDQNAKSRAAGRSARPSRSRRCAASQSG